MNQPHRIRSANEQNPALVLAAVADECKKIATVAAHLRTDEALAILTAHELRERDMVRHRGYPLDQVEALRARKRARGKALILAVAELARTMREIATQIAGEETTTNGYEAIPEATPQGQAPTGGSDPGPTGEEVRPGDPALG